MPIAVVGFPLGAALPSAKAFEAREAIRCGAKEIDMVINIGALKAKDYALVLKDICHGGRGQPPAPGQGHPRDEPAHPRGEDLGCALSKAAGAAFVKTSTGFSSGGGATAEDVALMRKVVGDDVGVKASGGVRSSEDAMKMIQAGANRIGASASVAIITGQKSTAKY